MGDAWDYLTGTLYNAATGTVSPGQTADMNSVLYQDIVNAGGDATDAGAAVAEQNKFLNNYWPARSPAQTLWDDLTGNPLGITDPSKQQNTSNWLGIIEMVAFVIGILLVLNLLRK